MGTDGDAPLYFVFLLAGGCKAATKLEQGFDVNNVLSLVHERL